MKVVASKQAMVSGLNIALKAVPNRTTNPILSCVLLAAERDVIRISGNSYDIGIDTIIEGEIKEPGTVAVDAKLLSDIVKKMPNGDVHIESENGSRQVQIKCGKSKFNLPASKADDFPEVKYNPERHPLIIDRRDLALAIQKTLFSVGANEKNAQMQGECIEVKDRELTVTALDGHRIAEFTIPLNCECKDIKSIIPGPTMKEISDLLSKGDGTAKVFIDRMHISCSFDNTILVGRVIEGDFFKTEAFRKMEGTTRVTVNKAELERCIDRAATICRERDKKPVVIDISGEVLNCSVITQLGASSEDVEVTQDGEDIRIGFNPAFLLDALRAIDDSEITLELTSAKQPCIIRNHDSGYNYVILPVNIN